MEREPALLTKIKAAIMGVNQAFGPPGDYGYSTKEGKALNDLYNVHNEVADELKLLAEIDAAMSEPLSAEESAAVDRSWQRFKSATTHDDLVASLSDVLRILEAVGINGGLRPKQIARMEAAKAVLAAAATP